MVINNARQSLIILSTSANNKKCQNRLLHFAVAKWLIMEHAAVAATTIINRNQHHQRTQQWGKMCADFCAMFRNYILPLQLNDLEVQSNAKHDCKRPSLFTFTLLHAMWVCSVSVQTHWKIGMESVLVVGSNRAQTLAAFNTHWSIIIVI